MNKTQIRLTELSNELQDIASNYEELSISEKSSIPETFDEKLLEDLSNWLQTMGFLYTYQMPLYLLIPSLKKILLAQSEMIMTLKNKNALLVSETLPHLENEEQENLEF